MGTRLPSILFSAAFLAAAGACTSSTTTKASSDGSASGDAGVSGDAGASGRVGNDALAGTAGDSAGAAGAEAGGESDQAGGSSSAGTSGSSSSAGGQPVNLGCRTYCDAIQASCVTDLDKQYKSDLSCMNSCAAFRVGLPDDTSGNTLGCRFHYAQAAAEAPSGNCVFAGPSGGGRCGTSCDGYCSLMAAVCPAVYEDDATCRSACVAMEGVDQVDYQIGGTGDNLQCRIYHATFAAEGNPELHCQHASPTPTSPCSG